MRLVIATLAQSAPDYAVTIRAGKHALTADEPKGNGGQGSAPGPRDLILAGLCSCTAITLRMYAQRKQWPIDTVEVSADLTVAGEHGLETYSIARRIKTSGELTPEQRARLADISERTPMTLLLKRGAAIKTTLT